MVLRSAASRGRATFCVRLLSYALLLFVVTACGSNVYVRSSFDPAAEFGRYRTFAMLLPNKPVQTKDVQADPFVLQRLRQVTYSRLVARGFRPVAREEADLLVHVLEGVQQRLEVYSTGYYGYGFRGPAFGYSVNRYEEGTVVIDLIDRSENAVVWRGSGARRVGVERNNEELQEVVDEILARYPPSKQAH